MTMLKMDYRAVSLRTMNPRIEHHGEETVRAVDLVFVFKTVNTVLDELAAGLRLAYYRPSEQGHLPGTELADDLRWPQVKSFKWDELAKDVIFTVHSKLHDEPDMAFAESKVGKIKVTPMQGGSVELSFMAQVYADPVQISRLYTLLDEGCKVSWREPTDEEKDAMAAKQKDMFPAKGDNAAEGDDKAPAEGPDHRLVVNGKTVESAAEAEQADRDGQQLDAVAQTMRDMDQTPPGFEEPARKGPSSIAKGIRANELKQERAGKAKGKGTVVPLGGAS
jgi:hypothetical protein